MSFILRLCLYFPFMVFIRFMSDFICKSDVSFTIISPPAPQSLWKMMVFSMTVIPPAA